MFRFDDTKTYRMPATFGDLPTAPETTVYMRDTVGLSVTCTTEEDRLARYVPDVFEILRPEVVIGFVQMREIDWMAGGRYNVVMVDVPVRYKGRRDRLEGNFNLVTWENRTTPILAGRDDAGIPKIYAEIQDLHAGAAPYLDAPDYFTNASYDGNTFVRMEMSGARPVEGEQLAALRASPVAINVFGWRYIPNVTAPGAAASYPVLFPQGGEVREAWIGSGSVEWIRQKPWQNPTQHHIINALADLPVIETAPVMMTKGSAFLKSGQARVLE